MIQPLSFKRHRFPGEVIRHAVWLYFRFTLSIRDVEEMMAQRGIIVSREAIRCWINKFGPLIAANLRRRRGLALPVVGIWMRWFARLAGRRMWLWRAVDDEGEVLDTLVQTRRNTAAAMKLFRKLLRNQGIHPETVTTDGLGSYRAALRKAGDPGPAPVPAACARTTGLKTATSSFDDVSESSRNSNPRDPPRDSSPPTAPSTTPSIPRPTS